MISFLAARVRRKYRKDGHAALWVSCCYMEPLPVIGPRWAVIVHPISGPEYEVARSRFLRLALWRAWRQGP